MVRKKKLHKEGELMKKIVFHHKPIEKEQDGIIYIDNTQSEYDHREFSEIAGFKILQEIIDGNKWKDEEYLSLNHYRREFDDKDCYNRTYIPQPMFLPTTVAAQYAMYHSIEDLRLCGQAVKEEFPNLVQPFEQVLNGNMFIPYNMAILTVSQFKDYSNLLFKVLENLHKKIGTETYEDRLDYIKRHSDLYTGEQKNNDPVYAARIESFCAERLSTFYWIYVSRQMPVFPCKVNLLEENQKI